MYNDRHVYYGLLLSITSKYFVGFAIFENNQFGYEFEGFFFK